MKIHCCIQEVDRGNTKQAQLRESGRMACIAWNLSDLGHDVTIDAPKVLVESNRWSYFSHLRGNQSQVDILLVPSELTKRPPIRCNSVVSIKTTKKPRDERFLQNCDLLVAREYTKSVEDNPKLLPVPLPVHDKVIDHFCDIDLMDAYLKCDVDEIRSRLCVRTKVRKAGFAGFNDYSRVDMANQMPDWIDWRWGDSAATRMSAPDYLKFMMECEMGINLRGAGPKAYRFSEMAMLGIPIVTCMPAMRDTPLVSEKNVILLRSHDDVLSLERGYLKRHEIAAEATQCYRDGWSMRGHAKMILERMS